MPLRAVSPNFPTRMLIALVVYAASATAQQAELAGDDWTKAEVVTVTMVDYAFVPRRVTFRHGVATRLHLVNNGTQIHDFTAPDFFQTVDLRDPRVLSSSGAGVTVEPNQQKDVDFVARLSGHFGLVCADHDWAGMTANIFVE